MSVIRSSVSSTVPTCLGVYLPSAVIPSLEVKMKRTTTIVRRIANASLHSQLEKGLLNTSLPCLTPFKGFSSHFRKPKLISRTWSGPNPSPRRWLPHCPSLALPQPRGPSVFLGTPRNPGTLFLLPGELWALLTDYGLSVIPERPSLTITAPYLLPSQHVAVYLFVYRWSLPRIVTYPRAGSTNLCILSA